MNQILMLCCLLQLIYIVSSYKLLVVFPTPVKSHYYLGNALAKALANAGNEVTIVSAYEEKNPPKNGIYKQVILTNILEHLIASDMPSWMEMGQMILPREVESVAAAGYIITNFTMAHPNFQKLINSKEKFDAVIVEQFVNDGLKILSCHYQIPLISLKTHVSSTWSDVLTANPAPPSYIPEIFSRYTKNMNIWQRILNTLASGFKQIQATLSIYAKQANLVKHYFPNCSQQFEDVLYNVSLTFINAHESISDPVPLVPSIIPIGGFHLNPQLKKLSNDLQKFLDESKEGVVYFSLGSNIIPSHISTNTKQALLSAFRQIKEQVLWKWDEDIMEGKPDNVKIAKWFPQQEILAHPNVKLFVSHGGLLSIIEAVHNGIPLLALPLFGDQNFNAARIEEDGFGLGLPLTEVTEEIFTEKLKKLLNDPTYRNNVKQRSVLLHDRPVQPLNLAIYWSEYIARHKGAPHLRVAGLNLKWYQYFLLDVIAILGISIISFIIAIVYLIKYILRIFVRDSKKMKK